MAERFYLRRNVRVEPLVNHWAAWDQLIPPHTIGLNIIDSHLPIMESYIADPVAHAENSKNPDLIGGPWADFVEPRVEAVTELLAQTQAKQAAQIEVANAITTLDRLLTKQAKGGSLEELYRAVPKPLKGFVELVYDINHHPSIRFLEGLIYRSGLNDRSLQGFALSEVNADFAPFQWSTPVIDKPILARAFADRSVDALFTGMTRDQVRELGVDALVTSEPPRTQRYSGAGVRVRYLGHACVLFETTDCSVLIDPFVSYAYPSELARFTYEDLPDKIDYVVITHAHSDHVELQTLFRLRHRIGTVIVPRSAGRRREDPSLRLILSECGFRDIRDLHELEALDVPGGRITAVPFIGEHSDLDIQTKSAYVIELAGRRFLCAADSANIAPELYDHLAPLIGELDALFLGMECEGSPLTHGYGALLTHRLDHAMAQSRRDSGSDSKQALALVRSLQPKHVYVYAMGQEPWLNHVLGIDQRLDTKPMRESKLFLEQLAAQGIPAEKPFGSLERIFG